MPGFKVVSMNFSSRKTTGGYRDRFKKVGAAVVELTKVDVLLCQEPLWTSRAIFTKHFEFQGADQYDTERHSSGKGNDPVIAWNKAIFTKVCDYREADFLGPRSAGSRKFGGKTSGSLLERLLAVRLRHISSDRGDREFVFVSYHGPNNKTDKKEKEAYFHATVELCMELAEKIAKTDVILGGDFNYDIQPRRTNPNGAVRGYNAEATSTVTAANAANPSWRVPLTVRCTTGRGRRNQKKRDNDWIMHIIPSSSSDAKLSKVEEINVVPYREEYCDMYFDPHEATRSARRGRHRYIQCLQGGTDLDVCDTIDRLDLPIMYDNEYKKLAARPEYGFPDGIGSENDRQRLVDLFYDSKADDPITWPDHCPIQTYVFWKKPDVP